MPSKAEQHEERFFSVSVSEEVRKFQLEINKAANERSQRKNKHEINDNIKEDEEEKQEKESPKENVEEDCPPKLPPRKKKNTAPKPPKRPPKRNTKDVQVPIKAHQTTNTNFKSSNGAQLPLSVDEDVEDQSHEKKYPFLPSVRKLTGRFEPLKADDNTMLSLIHI